jgi:ABC-2 type transport system permease protein
MSGLIYNEISKVVAQRRFAVVIVILTLLAILTALSMRNFSGGLGVSATGMVSKAIISFSQLLFPFFIAIITGDIVAGELSGGTMKLLLIRPVARWKIWLSKLLAAFIVSAVVVLYTGICVYVSLGAATKFGSWSAPMGQGIPGSIGIVTLKVFALELASIFSVVSLFMLLSTIVESGVAAVGLCAGLAFICSFVESIFHLILQVSTKLAWVEYFFFEHWQIAGLVTQPPPMPGFYSWSIVGSLVDLAVWTVFFVVAGIAIFQWKDVRG